MSTARLWRNQDKRQQQHGLFAPVYGWFTEGFDTLDLKEAKSRLGSCTPDNFVAMRGWETGPGVGF